ncbi:MAG: 4a-hydroxytetrahydrobiopterin dehydratase [Candidatus Lokiarchaeota archaeon]|nr:4a-hydroxytetrahydrobiopterin dehydratase [Candidatus Lokiarchaeota archaeon]
MSKLTNKKCVPCEGGLPAMDIPEENTNMKEIPEWALNREEIHKITREFKFKNFKKSMKFVNKVADIAEEEGHHPDIYIYYDTVKLELYTHAVNGLFINDFIIAAKVDEIYEEFQNEK